jgi:hypothetical protein
MPKATTVRERLVAGIGPASRKIMTAAHQLELIDRYPTLYWLALKPPARPFSAFALDGFTVGNGWFGIIERLSAALAVDPRASVGQVKEKHGTLRLYCSRARELDAAVDAASAESEQTCEICGGSGTIAARLRGWISVRCEPCEALDVAEDTCRKIADRARDLQADNSEFCLEAVRLHFHRLGAAAERQPAERRARLLGVDWGMLDGFRDYRALNRMTAADLLAFVRDKVPTIEEALR